MDAASPLASLKSLKRPTPSPVSLSSFFGKPNSPAGPPRSWYFLKISPYIAWGPVVSDQKIAPFA